MGPGERQGELHPRHPEHWVLWDHFLRPLFVDKEWEPYESKVLYVDPSGRGADETAWSIVAALNGLLYLIDCKGWAGDPTEAMTRIAMDARKYDVNLIEVEPNYGQGMWISAFQPILNDIWKGGCTVVESEWAKGQKELRIIDTLEPVLTQHRLVIDETLVRREAAAEDHLYSLLYQLTHITRDRGALRETIGSIVSPGLSLVTRGLWNRTLIKRLGRC